MDRQEIRLSGFGGQGLILAGYVIGKAAAVVEGRHATLNQSFGPEARGSACSAQVIVADHQVAYPYVRRSDVLVAMSQDAYRLFAKEVRENGLILIDETLVVPGADEQAQVLGIAAARIAESLGKRIAANMVMVGFFAATTGIVSPDAAREAVRTSVPSGTEELNLAAFQRGLDAGRALVEGGRRAEEVAP